MNHRVKAFGWPEFAKTFAVLIGGTKIKFTFARASLIRSAPFELPQDRKVARIKSCSGAI